MKATRITCPQDIARSAFDRLLTSGVSRYRVVQDTRLSPASVKRFFDCPTSPNSDIGKEGVLYCRMCTTLSILDRLGLDLYIVPRISAPSPDPIPEPVEVSPADLPVVTVDYIERD